MLIDNVVTKSEGDCMDKLLERFLQYVSLDTQSKPGVRQVPSTEGQWKLLNLLKEQLDAMGLVNVTLSEKGTVMGTLPANVGRYPGDWLYLPCRHLRILAVNM
jgi:tripeptide aminopeptidase